MMDTAARPNPVHTMQHDHARTCVVPAPRRPVPAPPTLSSDLVRTRTGGAPAQARRQPCHRTHIGGASPGRWCRAGLPAGCSGDIHGDRVGADCRPDIRQRHPVDHNGNGSLRGDPAGVARTFLVVSAPPPRSRGGALSIAKCGTSVRDAGCGVRRPLAPLGPRPRCMPMGTGRTFW